MKKIILLVVLLNGCNEVVITKKNIKDSSTVIIHWIDSLKKIELNKYLNKNGNFKKDSLKKQFNIKFK